MSTGRSSRFKERDDEYLSNRSHAYGKKRRRSPGLDIDDRGNRSSHKDKDHSFGESGGRDALADFRAGISEDEARHQSFDHYDDPKQGFSNDSHYRDRYRGAHNEHDFRHRDHSHSRSYKENRRNSDKHTSENTLFTRERECAKDISRDHRSSPDRETYESRHRRQLTPDEVEQLESYSRPNKAGEDRTSRFERHLKGYGQGERRGRSISRSSPVQSNSRPPSSRSTSASSAESPHHSHKRRRRRSRSRSPMNGRKDSRSRKHKRSPSRRKDRGESKRSVLTGKKIKLKVKKERGDDERDAKRQELLKFLNSAYE